MLALSLALCVTSNVLGEGGAFTTIDFPGAAGTTAWGVNNGGDIVGGYTLTGVRRGFLLSGGQFSKIEFPGATSTEAGVINPRGDIVGLYVGADKLTHGYLLSGDRFGTVDVPGSTLTLLSGINPARRYRGQLWRSSVSAHGRRIDVIRGSDWPQSR